GSDKYCERHRRRTNSPNDLQAVQLGHLYIEKDEIQRLALDDLDGSFSACRLQYASDIRVLFEHVDKALACGRFIIDHENADRFSGLRHWLPLLRIVAAARSPPLFRLRCVAERASCYYRQDGDPGCARADQQPHT